MTPAAISKRIALSSSLSMVNHHLARFPLSLRLISIFPSPASGHLDAGKLAHELPERITSHLEIGIMIEGGTGRRKQHGCSPSSVLGCIACRRCHRLVQGPVDFDWNRSPDRMGKILRRLAYQISPNDARKKRLQ